MTPSAAGRVWQTDEQLLARAAADGIASVYGKAELLIGMERITVKIPGRGVFFMNVQRGRGEDWPERC